MVSDIRQIQFLIFIFHWSYFTRFEYLCRDTHFGVKKVKLGGVLLGENAAGLFLSLLIGS